jgi:tetratricopeptide (TPR) repeat protein
MLLKALPTAAPVHVAAGSVAAARSDLAGARRAFSRAAELDPGNLAALESLVRLDFAEKKPEAALARIQAPLSANPQNPRINALAAQVYASSGDLAKAEQLLKKVVETDPSNMQAFSMLGQLYATQNRLAEARASFEVMLKDDPESVGVNTIVGMLYEVEGQRDEARKRYERVVQRDPNAAVAANNLAYIYAEDGGNLDMALQLAQAARQKLPESPEVADTLGWVYLKKDLASLAIPRLEEAAAKRPGDPMVQYHLGVALARTGQKIKGRQVLERALVLKLPEPAAAEARKLVEEL